MLWYVVSSGGLGPERVPPRGIVVRFDLPPVRPNGLLGLVLAP
jgi:hypothetical protein